MLFQIKHRLKKLFNIEYFRPTFITRTFSGTEGRFNIHQHTDLLCGFLIRGTARCDLPGFCDSFPNGLLGIIAFQGIAPGIAVFR